MYILKGCKCNTGCNTNQSKCKKSGQICGPGCQCLNCANTHLGGEGWDEEVNQLETEYVDETDKEMQTEMYEDEKINNIMELVFGEDAEDDYTYMEQ